MVASASPTSLASFVNRRAHNAFVYLTAGWAGFFGMSIEILGGRLLAPAFGTGLFVWGGLITVFMLALSFGYLLGGAASRTAPSLPRLQGLLALAALLACPIVLVGEPALDWLSLVVRDPRYGSLLGALLLFSAPTVALGMVSPYAVRLLIDDVGDAGHSAGTLYFASTIGSALGTVITSFYLVLWFELNVLIEGLIAVSLLLAAGAAAWARTRDV